MWRPAGWWDTNSKPDYEDGSYDDLWQAGFECGADAMLEALYKLAEESPTKTFTVDSRVINIYEVK